MHPIHSTNPFTPGSESPARQTELEVRRDKVWAYKVAGFAYRDIAKMLDVSLGTIQADMSAMMKVIHDSQRESIDQYRALELERLDTSQKGIWAKVLKGDTKAIDSYIKISKRRAALLGLDAPTKIEIPLLNDIEKLLELLNINPTQFFQSILSELVSTSGAVQVNGLFFRGFQDTLDSVSEKSIDVSAEPSDSAATDDMGTHTASTALDAEQTDSAAPTETLSHPDGGTVKQDTQAQ